MKYFSFGARARGARERTQELTSVSLANGAARNVVDAEEVGAEASIDRWPSHCDDARRSSSGEMTPNISDSLRSWATAEYSEFPYAYWGTNGTTLLFDALCQEKRRTILLPAFICPSLSAMLLRTGMKVLHIDVDRRTLHMNSGALRRCLAEHKSSETALLVDHTFGYPDAAIREWRRRYSDLLIIEDCVRALGGEIEGRPVGHDGNWVLHSLYKTTVVNDHGAVLLTRSPYAIRSGAPPVATLRQWASGVRPARMLHDVVKRVHPEFVDDRRQYEAPVWTEGVGAPNALCQARFERHLSHLTNDRERRWRASQAIQDALRDEQSLAFVHVPDECRPSAFFLSFVLSADIHRETLINNLHRRGLFLVWAWSIIPANYACFAPSFPYGSVESVFLANHVCHIPLSQYASARRTRRLISLLRNALRTTGA